MRHGESEGNRAGIMQGWQDVGLSPRGIRQARLLRPWLAGLRVVSSDLQRAVETARLLSDAPETVRVDRRLREVHLGVWQGRRQDEVMGLPEWAQYQRSPTTFRCPGGEALSDVQRRMLEVFREETARGDQVVLVSHRVAIRTLLVGLTGQGLARVHQWEIPNASVTRVVLEPGGPAVIAVGEVPDSL
ncbi:MAG: histidine phosphatase family protein [Thermaerobacter sp.]|nr:histidine phosphatase family protein [Thermaerobacter sp.]